VTSSVHQRSISKELRGVPTAYCIRHAPKYVLIIAGVYSQWKRPFFILIFFKKIVLKELNCLFVMTIYFLLTERKFTELAVPGETYDVLADLKGY
jgi:hypothetical protein